MVIVHDLTVQLQKQLVLRSVSCIFSAGRITACIGKSGAGKTTLLKTLAGLIPAPQGKMSINGKEITALSGKERSLELGYVFQDFNLFPHRSVLQNCMDPLQVHGMSLADAQQRSCEVLEQLGMRDFAHTYPTGLSGGQQQRVAIARALCLNPHVLILDEPTASLDPLNTEILVDILKRLAAQGLTIILSSQDMNLVRKIFDCVYYLEVGEIIEACDGIAMLTDDSLIAQFMR
jgi:ABC-type polar amino acid transport system ATPase subunit